LQRPEISDDPDQQSVFDEIGRLMNDAAGAAQGVKREVDTVVRNIPKNPARPRYRQAEEFERGRTWARLAREETSA
jgi:BMFP domain-containing protein YqiC